MKTEGYGANQVQGQRYQLLDERSARLQAVITGLAKAATPSRILASVLNQGASALGNCSGAVNVLSADGNSLRIAAQAGFPAPLVRLYRKCSVTATMPAADVLRSGEPLWIRSHEEFSARYPHLSEVRAGAGHEADAFLPLVVDQRALGVVVFSYEAARSFNTEEQSFLLALAHLSAQALARTHYYRQLELRDQKHAGQLRTLTAALQHEVADKAAIQAQLSTAIHKLRLYSAELNLAREKEGKRLAVEIHDQLGGSLTGLKMDVALLRRTLGSREPVAVERLGVMSKAIDSTIALVRQIATDLRPSILDDLGLLAALEWSVDEFQKRSGVASEFVANAAADTLDSETATVIFRVVQESLTNIARHAEATHVVILVEAESQALVVQVHDNGRGFAYSKLAEVHSLGLIGMQERVRAVAGELDIQTAPGQGTTVWIRMPFVQSADLSQPTDPHMYQ